ncbi:internal head protein [Erwinia phage vB_EamM_ChrisDB]|uniref:internal head protein n=1 Tax=Erwinia phage vB_EamM_ChrisDB TaxID=1883371 RepID=UPI00081D1038|nr:internal head protein [Erwinia phage vB_EamM_ChrisDB]ANZ48631.1 hypothetical protein CHRISDB_69 [Erwinia phage vB_EamM_ChrisDB]
MANFSQRKIARESIEGSNPNEIDGLSNVEPGEENLDTQLAEMASDDAQLEQLEGDGQTLSDDIDRTESAVSAADEAEANGEELSEESIAHTEVAQESIRRRWGIDVPRVARESFRRGRGMTKAAGEGWKDTLKDLWKRFIEFCKTVVNKIRDVKLKYLNVGKTAQGRAKKYLEAIRKLGKKEKDNISGGFISKLSIDGKFNIDSSIAVAKDVVGGKVKGAISAMAAQADSTATYVAKTADGETQAATSIGGGKVELFGTTATKLQNLPQFENGEGQKLMALPGNAYIQSGSKSLAGDAEFVAIAFMATGDATDDKEIETPATGKLSVAASALDTIGKGFEKVLQDFRAYDSGVEKLLKAAESAAAKFDKATEDSDRQVLSAARSAADQAVKNYQTLHRAVSYTANTVITGLNGYIGAGIGAYKKA